ncbi:hypothetical protein GE21DRAFT_1132792 [Neurospora crassa]|nr:hypothetical protein GE21DRAFT_1132792 [Neurospora crassa]
MKHLSYSRSPHSSTVFLSFSFRLLSRAIKTYFRRDHLSELLRLKLYRLKVIYIDACIAIFAVPFNFTSSLETSFLEQSNQNHVDYT